MPIYQYVCDHCAHELEEMQKFSDPALVSCPQCGTETLKRKLSVGAFHLKGSGWYKDGYGGRSNKAPESSKTESPAKETPKTESKPAASESKPAASSNSSSEKSTTA